jgi:Zn-dependent protease
MKQPAFLTPDDQPTTIGHVYGTAVVVNGLTGLPLLELVGWGVLSWVAGRKYPGWPMSRRVAAGAINTVGLLGSEWCHDLAHAAVAAHIGKPANAIRVFLGVPLLVYYEPSDQQVTPTQHCARALGGPIFNTLMASLLWLARRFTSKGSLALYSVDFAMKANVVLCTLALLPVSELDGGSILKWSLVHKGYPLERADELVKDANLTAGAGLAAASGIMVKVRRKWSGIGLAALAISCLSIGFGLLKE